VHLLGLDDKVRGIPSTAPAARNRFLHVPGTHGLTALPNSLASFGAPLGRSLLPEIWRDVWRWAEQPEPNEDTSIDEFVTRRLGPLAANVVSAVGHGVYAADTRVLSARAALGWPYKAGTFTPIIRQRMRQTGPAIPQEPYQVAKEKQANKVFVFEGGTETLVRALEDALSATENVTIQRGSAVSRVSQRSNTDIEVGLANGSSSVASHVVSALPIHATRPLLSGPLAVHPALDMSYTSVAVVTLVFERTDTQIVPPGFGYLVTRSMQGYTTDDAGIIGVIFDSYLENGGAPSPVDKLMRLTAMVGGPNPASTLDVDVPRVLEVIGRQLGARLPEPVFVQVGKNLKCIPTPTVGHVARVESLAADVKRLWDGRLAIVGAAVDGVAVGSCIEGGRKAAHAWDKA